MDRRRSHSARSARRARSARVLALAAAAATALSAAPAAAQPAPPPAPPPADEPIEMEPEVATPPAPAAPGDPAAARPVAPAKDPKAARRWLAAAQQLVQRGDALTRGKKLDEARAAYENAVTALQKAIEASDDPSPHAQLGDVYGKLGKPDLAARHYRVVVKATAGVRPDVLKRATAKLEEVAAQVGIVTLNVKPDGAVITLAGTELGKAPLAEPLILMPGTYTVALQAEGFQPKEAELVVEAGAESERAIELEPVQIIVQAPPKVETPVEPPKPPPGPSRLPLYVGGGAAIALLGAATVTGILAIGEHDTFTAVGSTPAQRADAKDAGQRLALLTDVSLAAGVVAGGFTAYWYFFKYRPAQRMRAEARPRGATAKVDVIPWVQGPSSGLSLVGAF